MVPLLRAVPSSVRICFDLSGADGSLDTIVMGICGTVETVETSCCGTFAGTITGADPRSDETA